MAHDGTFNSPQALVIDDNPATLRAHMRTLERMGFAPLGFGSGEDAVAWMELHGAPALAVVDVTLPRMSGFGVCTWIREHLRAVPTVATGTRPGNELDDYARALELDVELLENPRDLAAKAAALTGMKPAPVSSSFWMKLVPTSA